MKSFRFEAADGRGGVVRGKITALNFQRAREEVAKTGALPLRIEETHDHASSKRLSRRQLGLLLRSLATLTEAGVSLGDAVQIVERQMRDGAPCREIVEKLRAGFSFPDALATVPGVPPVAISMLRAGDKSGLTEALERAADHIEREAELRTSLQAAITYPAVLLLIGCAMLLTITTGVLPKFVTLISEAGAVLPTSTRVLVSVSSFVTNYWLLAIILLGFLVISSTVFLSTPVGHAWLLYIPVLGTIRHDLATARISRALGTLLAQGTPATVALKAAADAAGDKAIRERLRRVIGRVEQGAGITASLKMERAFPQFALEMIAAGEHSGKISLMLQRAADFTEAQAVRMVHTGVRLLEPGLILVLGAAVGLVAVGMLQAVYSIRL